MTTSDRRRDQKIIAVCGLGHKWLAIYTSETVRAAKGPGRRGGWTVRTTITPPRCPLCGHKPDGPQLPAE